jgi:hypothetical protein
MKRGLLSYMKSGWIILAVIVIAIILVTIFLHKETITVVDIPARQLPGIMTP